MGLPFIRHRNFGGADRSVTEYTMSEIIASVYDKMEQVVSYSVPLTAEVGTGKTWLEAH